MAILTSLTINDTGFIKLPSGTSAQRSSPATSSMLRYNSDLSVNEYYTGSQWTDVIPERSIVNNGLVLNLDAGNTSSYPSNRFLSYGTAGSGSGSDNNVGFAINGDGTFIRLGFNQTYGGYTIKPTDVVYRYNLGANGCHYHGNDIPIPAGVSATFSFDYFVSGATNYPSTNYLANFENALGGSIAAPNSNQDTWQRVSLTSGPTGGAGTLRALLYPGACGGRLADSGYILFKNPKVEYVSSDTGDATFNNLTSTTTWIDVSGKGNNGTLTNGVNYTSANSGAMIFDGTDDVVTLGSFFTYTTFTISLWVYPGSTQVQYADIFDNNHTGAQNFVCQQNSTSTNEYGFSCINASGASSPSTFTLTANTWHYLTFTWNNSVASVYINGTFYSSGAATNPINYSSQSLRLGAWGGGGRNWNGRMANFIAYNRVLSQAEILQNYNATRSRFGL